MGRVVDRARLLTSMVHEGRLDKLAASPDVAARWLKAYRRRAQARLSPFSRFTAPSFCSWAPASSSAVSISAPICRNYAALVLVLPGTVFLFAGAMWMVGETGASKTLVIEEIDNALETLKRKPPIDGRGAFKAGKLSRPARPEPAIPPPCWPATSDRPPNADRPPRPQKPRDIASRRVGFVSPFMAHGGLVDLVTSEIGAHRDDVAQGDVSTLRELLCAMNANRGSAPGGISRAARGPFCARRLPHPPAG